MTKWRSSRSWARGARQPVETWPAKGTRTSPSVDTAQSDRRDVARRRMLKPVQVMSMDRKSASVIDCTLRTLSVCGAQLSGTASSISRIPAQFYLIVPGQLRMIRSKVVWKSYDAVGHHVPFRSRPPGIRNDGLHRSCCKGAGRTAAEGSRDDSGRAATQRRQAEGLRAATQRRRPEGQQAGADGVQPQRGGALDADVPGSEFVCSRSAQATCRAGWTPRSR